MNFHTLIIDDDPVLIILMQKLISKVGYPSAPICFESGELALEFLQNNYNPKEVYAILLDINMPLMNGWEFLDEIKAFTNTSNTFVFIISSSINQVDIDLAKTNEYVLEYLSKPVFSETIIRLKEVLNEKTQSLS